MVGLALRQAHSATKGTKIETHKTRGVVVSYCLCISKSLENWIGLNNLLLESAKFLALMRLARDGGDILNDLFGIFRFSRTRLTTKGKHDVNIHGTGIENKGRT